MSNVPYERILGTIYGNCIGDAIGLLSEFMTREEAKTVGNNILMSSSFLYS